MITRRAFLLAPLALLVPAAARGRERTVLIVVPAHGCVRHTCCDCGLVHHLVVDHLPEHLDLVDAGPAPPGSTRITWTSDAYETRRERRTRPWWRELERGG